ncbi:MAG TPA: DUF2087 domain-containing protein [Acidimicrobiales bacterium]|nr:DUF2087 domain-containing protein [Acidimicrobiales bacterium]
MTGPVDLRPYFKGDRLVTVPRRRPARLALLDRLAAEFEPGILYSEEQVNAVLGRFHPDYCMLRRYLVDEDFLGRRDGMYWRSGGTFHLD